LIKRREFKNFEKIARVKIVLWNKASYSIPFDLTTTRVHWVSAH